MKKIQQLIVLIDCAQALLHCKTSQQINAIDNDYVSKIIEMYQVDSLAEKTIEVKNVCSHVSGERD